MKSGLSLVAAALLAACAGSASAQQFSNVAPITIPSSGAASPYPSAIVVSGLSGATIRSMQVTLNGLSHTYTGDIEVLLVSPQGNAVMLMSDTGSSCQISNLNLTFADGFPAVPNECLTSSGTYAPTNYGAGDVLTGAPAGPFGPTLASALGTNPNGTWLLYVFDDAGGDSGTIAGGWTISFSSSLAATPYKFTYQGDLRGGGSPVQGAANLEFRLFPTEFSTSALSFVSRPNTPVNNGLFTTTLDFGPAGVLNANAWLEIAVNGQTLSPRQQITPPPFAARAGIATLAENATDAFNATAAQYLAVEGSPLSIRADSLGDLRLTGGADGQAGIFSDGGTNGSIALLSPQGARLHLQNSGNVGIGTATPTEKLTVAGSMEVGTGPGDYQRIRIGGGNSNGYIYGSFPALGDGIHFGYNVYYNAAGQRITWALDGATSRISAGYGYVALATAGNNVAPVNRLYVATNGNVGIGTESPTQRLDVAGVVRCTSLQQTSSAIFKDDVRPLSAGLSELLRLEPVSYVWNNAAPEPDRGRHDLGFIAEDVALVLPDAVGRDASGKVTGIDYSRITVLAVQAIKEQERRHSEERAALEARLAKLEALLAEKATK